MNKGNCFCKKICPRKDFIPPQGFSPNENAFCLSLIIIKNVEGHFTFPTDIPLDSSSSESTNGWGWKSSVVLWNNGSKWSLSISLCFSLEFQDVLVFGVCTTLIPEALSTKSEEYRTQSDKCYTKAVSNQISLNFFVSANHMQEYEKK